MISLDFANAFNSVHRNFLVASVRLLSHEAAAYTAAVSGDRDMLLVPEARPAHASPVSGPDQERVHFRNSSGAGQGEPVSGGAFAAALSCACEIARLRLRRLAANADASDFARGKYAEAEVLIKERLLFFADDGYMLTDHLTWHSAVAALDVLEEVCGEIGLHLNNSKTSCWYADDYWSAGDPDQGGRWTAAGRNAVDVRAESVRILGVPFSLDDNACTDAVSKAIQGVGDAVLLLEDRVADPQSILLLTRACVTAQLGFLLRALSPAIAFLAFKEVDSIIYSTLCRVLDVGDSTPGDLSLVRLMTASRRHGGAGIREAHLYCWPGFVAMTMAASRVALRCLSFLGLAPSSSALLRDAQTICSGLYNSSLEDMHGRIVSIRAIDEQLDAIARRAEDGEQRAQDKAGAARLRDERKGFAPRLRELNQSVSQTFDSLLATLAQSRSDRGSRDSITRDNDASDDDILPRGMDSNHDEPINSIQRLTGAQRLLSVPLEVAVVDCVYADASRGHPGSVQADLRAFMGGKTSTVGIEWMYMFAYRPAFRLCVEEMQAAVACHFQAIPSSTVAKLPVAEEDRENGVVGRITCQACGDTITIEPMTSPQQGLLGAQHAERCRHGPGTALRHSGVQGACHRFARPLGRTVWEGRYSEHGVDPVAIASGEHDSFYDFSVEPNGATGAWLCDNSLVAVPMGGSAEAMLDKSYKRKMDKFDKPCRQAGVVFMPLIMTADGGMHRSMSTYVNRVESEASRKGVVVFRDTLYREMSFWLARDRATRWLASYRGLRIRRAPVGSAGSRPVRRRHARFGMQDHVYERVEAPTFEQARAARARDAEALSLASRVRLVSEGGLVAFPRTHPDGVQDADDAPYVPTNDLSQVNWATARMTRSESRRQSSQPVALAPPSDPSLQQLPDRSDGGASTFSPRTTTTSPGRLNVDLVDGQTRPLPCVAPALRRNDATQLRGTSTEPFPIRSGPELPALPSRQRSRPRSLSSHARRTDSGSARLTSSSSTVDGRPRPDLLL